MIFAKAFTQPAFWLVGGLLGIGLAGSLGYVSGSQQARVEGEARLQRLQAEHAEQARQAALDSRAQLLEQVERANQAESLLLDQQSLHAEQRQQLQERIRHVTSTYRSTLASTPVAVPRCIFTAGWVRDFNVALGARLPTAAAGPAAAGLAEASWPTPGTDAELLESAVTPADILAYAQDYGRWSRDNLAQLNALLDLHKEGK